MYTIIQSKGNAIREKWCDIYSTLQRWMTWMRHLYCCSTDIGVNNPPILAASSPILFKSQRPLVSMAVIPRQFTIKSLPFHSVLYVQYKSQPVVYSPRVCSLRLSGVRHYVEVKIRLEWAVRISMISTRRQLSSPRRLFIYTS